MVQDLNKVEGRIKASQEGEWRRFLSDRRRLDSAQDEPGIDLMHDFGPPCNAP